MALAGRLEQSCDVHKCHRRGCVYAIDVYVAVKGGETVRRGLERSGFLRLILERVSVLNDQEKEIQVWMPLSGGYSGR